MMNQIYSLLEISNCNLKNQDSSLLWIPPIQRGLVWKSNQVELLWDSILSGYPIGSLLVLKHEEKDNNGQLLDGQQRVNTIIQGFDLNSLLSQDDSPKSIIWIDLDFQANENRNFGIMVTTQAHPWGYELDGSKLSVANRREILRECGFDCTLGKLNKSTLDIRLFWPTKASLPVPLSFIIYSFFHLENENKESFRESVITLCSENHFGKFSPNWYQRYYNKINVSETIDYLYDQLLTIKNYAINANIAIIPKGKNERIELLFNRINTLGTNLTSEELAYSAIKLYWPEITTINQKIASKCMEEAHFAQLIFRMFNNTDSNYRLSGSIDAKRIRKYATEQNNEYIKAILDSYRSGTVELFQNQVSEWILGVEKNKSLPSVLLTDIANTNPDIYVLALRLAKYKIEDNIHGNNRLKLSDEYIRALILFLHCFTINNNNGISLIYEYILTSLEKDSKNYIDERNLSSKLAELYETHFIQPISKMNNFRGFNAKMTLDWRLENFSSAPYYNMVDKFFNFDSLQSRTMLWIAQRKFFKEYFSDYNPARRDLWENDNRPWDRDHIVPYDWQNRKSGPEKEFIKKWICSSGNRADIPFEINRSKRDKNEWEFYNNNIENLFFDNNLCTLTQASILNKENALFFSEITKNRFIKLYNEFYEFIAPLEIEETLSPFQKERKQFMLELLERLNNSFGENVFSLRAVLNQKEVEFSTDEIYYWRFPWLTISTAINSKLTYAVTIGINFSNFIVETGKRKHWLLNLNDSNWWPTQDYLKKNVDKLSSDKIKELINDWINKIKLKT